jgi:serine/threonine-protein kinase HipA
MTPLYDVMRAAPSVAAGRITRRQAKLAMSLGKSRHYRLDAIMPRHLEQTAVQAGVDPRIVRDLYREFVATAQAAASRLAEDAQGSVPDAVRLPILDAVRSRLRSLAAAIG